MSDKEEYTNIEIDMAEMSEAKQLLMLALLNEGRLRERERIIELLETQLAEQKVGAFYADAIRASILIIKGETNE
jgi:hypothetical protein